jgi:hypothetical protein
MGHAVTGEHKERNLALHWGFNAKLKSLLCKKITVKVKAGWSNSYKSGRIFQGKLWLKKELFWH